MRYDHLLATYDCVKLPVRKFNCVPIFYLIFDHTKINLELGNRTIHTGEKQNVQHTVLLVIKDMDVNEYDRLSNITLSKGTALL